jgi:hypothetical protein
MFAFNARLEGSLSVLSFDARSQRPALAAATPRRALEELAAAASGAAPSSLLHHGCTRADAFCGRARC